MKQHLEIEFKTIITASEYDRILKHFTFDEEVIQTNTYFDTKERDLYKQGIMCRIRSFAEHFEFTLKIPQEEGVLEYETQLSDSKIDTEAIHNIVKQFGVSSDKLVVVAKSNTNRKIHSDVYGQWCLDSNEFSHHDDLELEYELFEANEKAYPHYLDMLQLLGVEYKHADPKYIRALNSSNQ